MSAEITTPAGAKIAESPLRVDRHAPEIAEKKLEAAQNETRKKVVDRTNDWKIPRPDNAPKTPKLKVIHRAKEGKENPESTPELRVTHRAKTPEKQSPKPRDFKDPDQSNVIQTGVEKSGTFAKKLALPYYWSRRDFLDGIQLKFRDKNLEEARARGHKWIPKWVCSLLLPLGVGNYVGKVLDTITGPVGDFAWHTRQKITDGIAWTFRRPARAIRHGVSTLFEKTGRLLLGAEGQSKFRQRRMKFIQGVEEKIGRLDRWMKAPVKLKSSKPKRVKKRSFLGRRRKFKNAA